MKKLLKTVAIVLAMSISAVLLTACGSSSQSSEAGSSESSTTLRIAAQPFPLYTPVFVAYDLGYLKEEFDKVGADFTWDLFNSGPLVNEAVAAGEADMGFMADLPAIIAKSTGQPIEIVSNVAYGEKGLAVLVQADSDIKSVAELKGKKVAYATGSYAQHLLALLLSNEGLSLDDVETINLGAGDSPAALAAGEVDAIVIWEQFISKLTTDGTAKVLADGTGVKKGNMITYFVSDYANAHPDVVKAYINALNRANEYIEKDPEAAAELVAADFNIDKELMSQIIPKFTYKTSLDTDDIAEITKVKDFSLEAGIISNDVDMDSFINTSYLN
ncbi:MAG: aliphatic sulfonate ABC transporter substrate-binding protein [Ruminococcus sp.]|nr:aliphatic sulfonate ABC transporter substrate-binding protein [Ruminococcus sp.]